MSNTIAYSALDWIRTDVQVDALERHANTQQQSTSTAELIVVDGKTREVQGRIEQLSDGLREASVRRAHKASRDARDRARQLTQQTRYARSDRPYGAVKGHQ